MTKKYKIGIIGSHGMVGGALRRYFEKKPDYELYCYDKKGVGSIEEVNKADYIYIALPTPYEIGKGCNINLVRDVIKELNGGKVIIIKSTIPPGTTQLLQNEFLLQKILFNPEFLTEETVDQDMSFPDSQIIGYTEQSYSVAKDVLQQLPLAPHERIVKSEVAEFIKYAKNVWFSIKVAHNNEMYDLAKRIGFNEEEWEDVVDGIAADRRVGRTHLKIIHKGKRGYWGKCLPKDTKALLDYAKELRIDLPILIATDKYNDELLDSQGFKKFI